MKRSVAIVMALAFLLAVAGAAFAVSDVIKLSKNYKGGLDFTHKTHVDYVKNDCKKCHHTGENSTCTGCHDATGSKANGMNAKTAFHKQCKDCHKAEAKGPTACTGCHAG